ncbi:MAG: hypothetical protein AB7U60_09065 [Diaphorobacter sp.]
MHAIEAQTGRWAGGVWFHVKQPGLRSGLAKVGKSRPLFVACGRGTAQLQYGRAVPAP